MRPKPSLEELIHFGQDYERHAAHFTTFVGRLPDLIEQAGIPSLQLSMTNEIRLRYLGRRYVIDLIYQPQDDGTGASLLTSHLVDTVDEKIRQPVAKLAMDNFGNVRLGPNKAVIRIDQNPDKVLFLLLTGVP